MQHACIKWNWRTLATTKHYVLIITPSLIITSAKQDRKCYRLFCRQGMSKNLSTDFWTQKLGSRWLQTLLFLFLFFYLLLPDFRFTKALSFLNRSYLTWYFTWCGCTTGSSVECKLQGRFPSCSHRISRTMCPWRNPSDSFLTYQDVPWIFSVFTHINNNILDQATVEDFWFRP